MILLLTICICHLGETKTTYNISGKVWIDTNKDGIYSQEESGKEAVVVTLYGANSDGGIDTSKLITSTVTSKSGEYKFEKVENGNYVVVFSYDTSIYNVTKYQVSTALSTENSDVVFKKMTINGAENTYGMTDVLTIENSSLINIDMGLVSKNDFDLSLDKYISKVTVKNNSGEKTYSFENGENEKIEISSKYYKSSTLDITYKIVVNNEGEISGYINKLVDYMPEGMTVDLNENPGWYYGDDGNLYYNGLVGKEIKAGSSEEITLTLEQSLEEGNALTISNSAEIVEYTNSLGYEDIDSVSNNKKENEDDFGKVGLVISISTGETVGHVLKILFTIIIISGALMIIIKRKKINKIYK
jgi:hypothetical protein